jgi:hypothetical protein
MLFNLTFLIYTSYLMNLSILILNLYISALVQIGILSCRTNWKYYETLCVEH